jgi:2-hydroxychromene-2-carboxylate isomerase
MNTSEHKTQLIRFLFDPSCPWAYRASLWLREAAKVRPIEIRWESFSLEYVNRNKVDGGYLRVLRRHRRAFRLLAKSRQVAGNRGIAALYAAVGAARHEQRRALNDENMLEQAVNEAGLPPEILALTKFDPELDAMLEARYAQFVEQGAFGVPTLFIDDHPDPFYGPLIDVVPTGEAAGALWDHVSALIRLPYFYELKRNPSSIQARMPG